jgi:hypothetical protein
MVESESSTDRPTGWQDKTQKARVLAGETSALAARARAAGFHTAEYILSLAAAELWKDIDAENKEPKKLEGDQ